jgi:hypothetical protein
MGVKHPTIGPGGSRDSMVHTRIMVRKDRIDDPPNLAEILEKCE